MDESLLTRVRATAIGCGRPLPPPATADEVAAAEAALGFPLPDDYRAVLLGVANGGFGPAEGLLGVPGPQPAEMDAVEAFRRHAADGDWPAGLVPVVYLGAEGYHCAECLGAARRVVEYNPDFWELEEQDFAPADWAARAYPDHPTPGCFAVVAASIAGLLEAWSAGRVE